jgi:hypothetical protein
MAGFRLFGRNKALFDFGFCTVIKNEANTNIKYAIPLPYFSVHFVGQSGRNSIRWR